MKKSFIAIFLIIFLGFPIAYGHPYLIEANPPQGSNVPAGITEVVIYYSEAVEIDFSSIKVLDSSGEQIDNKDTRYYEGEESLAVTTPPLTDGIYTVTSKVLSKVDGHLVDYAYVFAVGDVTIDPEILEKQGSTEQLFFPEAGARFPGLVGQTIVLGAVMSSIFIWGTQKKEFLKNKLEQIHESFHSKFISLVGIGIIAVFASNIIMLAIQTMRLQTSAFDVLMTNFGATWIIRMIITVVLLGIWFVMERKKTSHIKSQIPLLVVSLALIATTTMLSHGAASELGTAIVLDYVHNFISSVWVGGIIFFGFCLLPVLNSLDSDKKEKMSLVLIPRFSIMFVIAIGIIIITGPILLWFLESNVNSIVESTYGRLIFAKIAIASVMIALGGYHQFKIQKKAEKNISLNSISVHKKLKRYLKLESALGITLLGVVALLANGTLPAGEVEQAEAQEITYGFKTIEFSDNAKFDVEIFPFTSGENTIRVLVSDFENNPLEDISGLKIKISNPTRNIAPIEIPITEIKEEKTSIIHYEGEGTFGFSGKWQIEIEAQRTQNVNEGIFLNVLIKPRLNDLKIEIIEYEFPENPQPLFPIYDGKENLWISDPSAPRLWKFSLEDQQFNSYEFDGMTSIMLTMDDDGKIWFTDTPGDQFGFFDPTTEEFELIDLPWEAIPISILSDFEKNIWLAIFDKNLLLKYDPQEKQFEEIPIPTEEGGPFALVQDTEGQIWFTESASGKIGNINPKTGEIKEYSPENPIKAPEALYFDSEGNLWITAHTGATLVKFDPFLETFERFSVPDPEALPFGMVEDRFGNIWFAQHTIDKIGVYDPHNDDLIEIDVPTETSFVQFVTADDNQEVWFVEQKPAKLAMVKITEVPRLEISEDIGEITEIKYAEFVSPLISLGIIATSLFFVKSVKDKRRLNNLVQ